MPSFPAAQPDPSGGSAPASSSISAEALAAQLGGGGRPRSRPTPPPRPTRPAPAAPGTPGVVAPAGSGGRPFAEQFREELERNIDLIIRRVEDRLITELERRGGRAWRGF